ncbi:MAG: hypothetical protein JOZ41_05090, partial [Chloroflexi bacterium]|nr:hypothetical protein [Chloroflexota bacterium]
MRGIRALCTLLVALGGIAAGGWHGAEAAATSVQPITEYRLPTPFSGPFTITAGPDGTLWFSERSGDRIGRISPAGSIAEFPVPTPDSEPAGIAVGPDGNIWFAEYAGNKIGKLTPQGQVTEYPIKTRDSHPFALRLA